MKRIFIPVLLCAALLMLTGCDKTDCFSSSSYAMGTFVNASVYADEDCSAEIFSALSESEQNVLSWRIDGSEIANLNNSGQLSKDAVSYNYIKQCLDIAQQTGGAFDITVLPVSKLWDFGGENQRLPRQDEISEALQHTGYGKIVMTDDGLKLPDGFAVELGAVGKGIGCDIARDVCAKNAVDAAVVSVGGSVLLYGNKSDGKKWKISVRDPNGGINDSMAYLSLDGGYCISTSGSYEKTFVEDGKSYHHILDAHTGYPAQSGLVSVTIVHESGLVSDALSTACFILGLNKGMELAEKYGALAVFADENNNVYVTEGLYDSIDMTNDAYTLSIY